MLNIVKTVVKVTVLSSSFLLFNCTSEQKEEKISEPEIEKTDHAFRNQFLTSEDSGLVYLNPDTNVDAIGS